MKVAALFDVHGNVFALEAVLAEVEREDADIVVFGGDIAHGPFPVETFDLAHTVPNARFVRGNADLLREATGDELADSARAWAIERLGDDRVEWLACMPFSQSIDDTLYVHANPRNVYDVVTERTPDAEVAAYLDGVAARRIVTGHIHLQFRRRIGDVEWIADDSAFRRTDYDVGRAWAAVASSGHPRAEEWARPPTRAEALAFLAP